MTSPRRRHRQAALVALTAALGLSACAGSDGGEGASSSSSSAAASASSALPAGTGTLPDGARWVEAPKSRVRFGVPEDFSDYDPANLAQGDDIPPQITALAKSAGMSAEQLIAQLRTAVDVMVVAPGDVSDGVANLSVITVPGQPLPSAGELEIQLEAGAVRIDSRRRITTKAGNGYLFSGESSGQAGRYISIKGPSGFVQISMNAPEDADVDALATGVVESLSKAS
ncbi:hypothetical protein [Janibacter sp. G1551]|uniref:hypothetical protein n=1 Tax=Janibacter sp. G1551 TaxID=3420440 RepID=UPI003CFBF4BF